MTPSVGRIVIVKVDPKRNNGADVAPAVITRVWAPDLVNLKVLKDAEQDAWMTSVKLLDTAEDAAGQVHVCYWPPRV